MVRKSTAHQPETRRLKPARSRLDPEDATATRLDPQGEAALRRAETLATWLDSKFSLFGIRFGLDTIVGLIPGVGDAATAAAGLYLVAEAAKLGAPKRMMLAMLFNIALDAIIGSIPLLGDIFDLVFKAHIRNTNMLRRYVMRRAAASTPA